MRVLLSGYYGFDNAGDDAVLFAIVQALREIMPAVDITVLSNQPEKTAAQFEVHAVDRWSKAGLLKAVKNCDILITGDLTAEGERALLRRTELPHLTALVVGHHGASTSTCDALLQATTPETAVISVGKNSYGHPREDVLERLETWGCRVMRTDQNGTIRLRR